jgi:hypothetical protein
MASKKESSIPPEKLALYDALIATHLEIERKGVTLPYTSANGNMFSFVSASGDVGLRLPKGAREDFLTKYQTKLIEANGVVMKEYVLVPETLLRDLPAAATYLALSYQYVQTLKPKPTKKK